MKFDAKILEDLAEWFGGLKEIKFSEILDATGKFERGAGADDGSHKKGGESNAVNQNERNLAANLKSFQSVNRACLIIMSLSRALQRVRKKTAQIGI